MHWMDEARVKCLSSVGIIFSEWHKLGYNLVLRESNVKYKSSLKPRDKFIVKSEAFIKGKLKIVFKQTIVESLSNKICIEAVNTVACFNKNIGKPVMPLKILNCFLDEKILEPMCETIFCEI